MCLIFFKKPKTAVQYRLVWFELQITPSEFRFAIMPQQPILIGSSGRDGQKGTTLLIRYDHVPEEYEKTVEHVDRLIKTNKLLEVHYTNPEKAFHNDYMQARALHVRFAYADDTSRCGVFELDALPEPVQYLLQGTRAYGELLQKANSNEPIAPERAQELIKTENNEKQVNVPKVIVKIVVHISGEVTANGATVSLNRLDQILDELKAAHGAVWYYRDAPDRGPSQELDGVIKNVLDKIIHREIPIQLQEDQF